MDIRNDEYYAQQHSDLGFFQIIQTFVPLWVPNPHPLRLTYHDTELVNNPVGPGLNSWLFCFL